MFYSPSQPLDRCFDSDLICLGLFAALLLELFAVFLHERRASSREDRLVDIPRVCADLGVEGATGEDGEIAEARIWEEAS